jgi:hypothetical protein
MHPELINLLPEERLKRLRREYFYHLGTVALLLSTLLLVIHGALLIPTDDYLSRQIATRSESLDVLKATLASADEQKLSTRLSALAVQTAALAAVATSTQQTAVLGKVLAVAHPGVALSAFTLMPPSGRLPETVTVSGLAATRDSLRAYYLLLSSAPFIASANLPVSDYAAASNISFTIMLAITPTLP